MVENYPGEIPRWESLEEAADYPDSMISSKMRMIDLKTDDESFIAISESILNGIECNQNTNFWDHVPQRLQKCFLDALNYRKGQIPTFPDPGDNEVVILTRKIADLMPPNLPQTIKTESSDEESSRSPFNSNRYNRREFGSPPQIDVKQEYSNTKDFNMRSFHLNEIKDGYSQVAKSKVTSPIFDKISIGTTNINRSPYTTIENNCIEEGEDWMDFETGEPNTQIDNEKDSYTFAQIMKQRSETRRQLLSEIRKTTEIIDSATMSSMKELGERHLKKLQSDLQKLNHAPDELQSIQSLVLPNTESSLSKSEEIKLNLTNSISSQTENFETVPLSPQHPSSEYLDTESQFDQNACNSAMHDSQQSVDMAAQESKISLDTPSNVKNKSIRFNDTTNIRTHNRDQCHSFPPCKEELRIRPSGIEPMISSPKATRVTWKQVVAPCDLPEGYRFRVRLGNHSFVATVPAGGAKKGEIFETYPDDDVEAGLFSENSVVLGRWRDGLCNCLDYGFDHPMFLNGLCCPLIALTQIMTRMHLNWSGHHATSDKPASLVLASILTICVLCSNALLLTFPSGSPSLNYILIAFFDAFCFAIYVVLVSRVRKNVRILYSIPENKRCIPGFEDIFCSICCTVCTVTQMGRHTAEYDTYRARCFSVNGLPSHIKLPLPPPSPRKNHYVPFNTP